MASTFEMLLMSLFGHSSLSIPLFQHYQGWDLTIEALGRFNQPNNLMFHILLPCIVVKFVLITLQETLTFTCSMEFTMLTATSQPSYKV